MEVPFEFGNNICFIFCLINFYRMKRKLLSALMFGALFAASASLTSCKDYDDDIQNNTESIKTLKTDVSNLTSALNTCKTDCQSKIDAAVSNFNSQIDAAKASLNAAIAAKADASTVSALADRVAQLETDEAAQVAALTAQLNTINDAIAGLNTAVAEKLDQSDFNAFKEAYDQAVAAYTVWYGQVNDKLAELKSADEKIATEFGDSISAHRLAITDLKQQIAALEALQGGVTSTEFQSKLDELKSNLTTTMNEKNSKLGARIDSLAKVTKTTLDKIGDLEDADKATNLRIDTLSSYLNKNYVTITTFNDKVATLTTLIHRELTSLVLKPGYYYGGIEAVEVPMIEKYKSYTVAGALTANEVWTGNGSETTIDNGGVATYHVNPAIANLEGYSIDFYGNDPITRAGIQYVNSKYPTFDALYAADKNNFKNGLVYVPFTVNHDAVNNTLKAGRTPMIAVQMTKKVAEGDRVVTSDYALLNITKINSLIIADIATAGKNDHVQQTAADLQHNHVFGQGQGQKVADITPENLDATHEVVYEGRLNLDSIIETHYSYTNPNDPTTPSTDLTMDEGTFKALGLKYSYALVDYKLTGRNKSEKDYVTLTQDEVSGDYVVKAVKDDKESARGHMPIVRVTLTDAKGNVLKYGYIKLKVAGETAPVTVQTNAGPKKVDCTGITFDEVKLTTAEKALYTDSRIDMTADQFAATYHLDKTSDVVNQYELKDNKYAAATAPVGTITVVDGKYSWAIPASYTDTMKVAADGTNLYPISTYVKYTNGGTANAYVKLVVAKGAIVRPIATLDPSNKVAARWYKPNGTDQSGEKAGLTEIHVNPEVVGQPDADDEITYDMLKGFEDQTVKFTFSNAAFTNADVTDYVFGFNYPEEGADWIVTGKTGSTYKLTISSDKMHLFATTVKAVAGAENITDEEIATLSGVHNRTITYNAKALDKFTAAYDILNKNGHKELNEGETFKVYIGIRSKVCEFQEAGEFTVRFLRPVDLNTTSYDVATDAVDNGSYINLKDLFVTPSDWRDKWLDSYWQYYGVRYVTPDMSRAYTDAALTEAQRVAYKPGFEDVAKIESLAKIGSANVRITYEPTATAEAPYGQLLYVNNNATIKNFHIYVPIVVTYDWGWKEVMGYARLNVNTTVNNAKRN